MFRIELMPAAKGDALWIEYGVNNKVHRVLIDGGTPPTYGTLKARIRALPADDRRFELVVVSHVDGDHIGGILDMVEKNETGAVYDEIWFNGYGHLVANQVEPFGPVDGERLTRGLLDQGLKWNSMFSNGAVCLDAGGVPVDKALPGGLRLTVLSPTRQKLADLKPVWKEACREAGLDPQEEITPEVVPGVEPLGPIDVEALAHVGFKEDDSPSNGSSIAILAEFEGKRVLLGADAHPTVLVDAIERIVGPDKKMELAACKLPHHGSSGNVSPDLVKKLKCPVYMVSTDGESHPHPSRNAIARVIKFGGEGLSLVFNYRSAQNRVWDDDDLRGEYGYTTEYPTIGKKGIIVDL
jgi:beta-lactamase superfamily II metal-dependent hydrolase